MPRVLITGVGIISAIGNNLSENLDNLKKGKTGIAKAQYFETSYKEIFPFGEVKVSNSELECGLELKNKKGLTRTCLLALNAFNQAIKDSKLSCLELSSSDTAFISASTVGGMCLTDQLYEDANLKSSGSDYLEAYGCGAHTLRIVEEYSIGGFTDTINTACSSSANAIMLGARLIKSGRAKRVVVGGVDSLAKYTVNGFNALKILSEEPCKPFDETRTGLNLGEGAAYLVLEAESEVKNKKIYAEIKGYGNANDAHHPSAMSPEATGVINSIKEALSVAQISPSNIDYINSHGTGTENNDRTELFGLIQVFGKLPYFNSTKSYTGHTLGAAGAIEAVFSILSMNNREVYPSLHVKEAISEFNTHPTLILKENIIMNYVLSNSFGFAGNCTSLIFGKV